MSNDHSARDPAGAHSHSPAFSRRSSLAAIATAAAGLMGGPASARPEKADQPAGTFDAPQLRRALGSPESGLGSEMVAHRRTPSASVTSSHGKLRHIVMAQEDYGLAPGRGAPANAAALQRAVDDAQVIILPNSVDVTQFSRPIIIPPHTQLVGAGPARTRLSATGGMGFVYEATNGSDVLEGPKFADFSLQASHVGIKLNDEAGRFTDTAESQMYISRARLDRVRLVGPGHAVKGSRGIDFNKVFHAVIDQCEILGFEVGVKFLGCDFPNLRGRTRVWQCGVLIQVDRTETFGSSCIIEGCDLLHAQRSFLKASDHHLIFRDNYCEQVHGRLTGPALDIGFSYATIIENNRLELPATVAPELLRVTGEGVLFRFENNSNRGPGWGKINWNEGRGARYQYNDTIRQKIFVRGNYQDIRVPFASVEPIQPLPSSTLWALGPDVAGLVSPYNYVANLRVQDGAWVLPNSNDTLIRLKGEDDAYSGDVNVYALARGDVEGQQLVFSRTDGHNERPAGEIVTQPLTREYARYQIYSGVRVSDPHLIVRNNAARRGGNAYLKRVWMEIA